MPPKNRELRHKIKVAKNNFLDMPVKDRLKYLDKDVILNEEKKIIKGNEKPFHFIYMQSFNKEIIVYLCKLADAIRELRAKMGKNTATWLKNLLPHKRIIGLFNQVSSRTETSFQAAAQNLGMDVILKNLETSSQKKRESWSDTVNTFATYADVLFIRHSKPSHLEEAVWVANMLKDRIPIINAGSGPDTQPDVYQHPTQTLLNIYTLWRSFEEHGGIEGRVWLLSGDLNSRVTRSDIYASRHFPPKKIYLNCPKGGELKEDMVDFLKRRGTPYEYCKRVSDVIDIPEIISFYRWQKEYYKKSKEIEKLSDDNKLLWKDNSRIKKTARIMHPLPKNDEIDEQYDFSPDPFHQFVYNRYQMKNGEWMRTAILAYLFGVDKKILEYYNEQS